MMYCQLCIVYRNTSVSPYYISEGKEKAAVNFISNCISLKRHLTFVDNIAPIETTWRFVSWSNVYTCVSRLVVAEY